MSHPSLLTDCFLQEICCPSDSTCRGSLQTSNQVFCCPGSSSCSDNTTKSPKHAFECPASVLGGCCAISLRCTSDLYIEYHHTTLVMLQPLPAENNTSFISQGFYGCIIPAIDGAMQAGIPSCSLSTGRALPTSASQNCQPENVSQEGQDPPISDTILDSPFTWRAKMGGDVVQSQAEENWDGKKGKRRLRGLGRLVIGLLVITVVMFVF